MVDGTTEEQIIASVQMILNDYEKRANTVIKKNKEIIDSTKKQTVSADKNAAQTKKLTQEQNKLKTALLGVGFFGKYVQYTLSGLFQPAFEAAGVTSLFSDMLTIGLLPAVTDLIGPLMTLINWVSAIPTPVKKAIGDVGLLVLGLAAAGSTLAFVKLGFENLGGALDLFLPKAATAGKTALPGGALSPLLKIAGTALGISFVINGIDELKRGGKEAMDGIADVISGAGLTLAANGTGAVATAGGAFAIGAILFKIGYDGVTGQVQSMATMVQEALGLAFAGYVVGGVPGAIGFVTIGVLFKFVLPNIIDGAKKWAGLFTGQTGLSLDGPGGSIQLIAPPQISTPKLYSDQSPALYTPTSDNVPGGYDGGYSSQPASPPTQVTIHQTNNINAYNPREIASYISTQNRQNVSSINSSAQVSRQ